MIVRDERGDYIGLACDTCHVAAPSAKEIIEGHGLIRMGWHCTGGTHLCPEHHPDKKEQAA
jgi:hypothetical protein